MPSREEIAALRAGAPLPAHRIIPLRSKGMHSIRFEFVVRLLRTSLTVDTLSIYWEHGHEFLLKQTWRTRSAVSCSAGSTPCTESFRICGCCATPRTRRSSSSSSRKSTG